MQVKILQAINKRMVCRVATSHNSQFMVDSNLCG